MSEMHHHCVFGKIIKIYGLYLKHIFGGPKILLQFTIKPIRNEYKTAEI